MISGSVALTTSNNTTSSLTYINNLVTGATTSGSYFTYASNQYINENIASILRGTYGYKVSVRDNFMGTNNEYLISWGTIDDPITYTIGQAALGGTIAYINGGGSTGMSGLVVNSSNLSSNAAWGCRGTEILTTSASIGTGNANTIAIMGGCATAGIAARLCGDLTEGGYSDWYLPSKDELHELYLNRVAINTNLGEDSIGGYLWTSTEGDSNYAWIKNFADNSDGLVFKDAGFPVRAVRSF